MFRCYTLHGWDFCLHQPVLVMRSHGKPVSTSVKVVTTLKRISRISVFGHFTKCQQVKFATNNLKFPTGQFKTRFCMLFSFKISVFKVFSWQCIVTWQVHSYLKSNIFVVISYFHHFFCSTAYFSLPTTSSSSWKEYKFLYNNKSLCLVWGSSAI